MPTRRIKIISFFMVLLLGSQLITVQRATQAQANGATASNLVVKTPSGTLTQLPNGKTRMNIQLSRDLASKKVLIRHTQKNDSGKQVSIEKRSKVNKSGGVTFISQRKIKSKSFLKITLGSKVVFKGRVNSLIATYLRAREFKPRQFVVAYNVSGTIHVAWNELQVQDRPASYAVRAFSSPTSSQVLHQCSTTGTHCIIRGAQSNLQYNLEISRIPTSGDPTSLLPSRTVTKQAKDGDSVKHLFAAVGIVLDAKIQQAASTRQISDMSEFCSIDDFDEDQFSPDGRYVSFLSGVSIVSDDSNCLTDVYLLDLETGEYSLVSVNEAGAQGDAPVTDTPAWSSDAQWLAFWSAATNLVAGVDDGNSHLYIKNVLTNELIVADRNDSGEIANGGACGAANSFWSPEVTKIAFRSEASNLVESDSNNACDLFVKDLVTGEIQRVNTFSDGSQMPYGCCSTASPFYTFRQFWSPSGKHISFVAIKESNRYQSYVKDLTSGELIELGMDQNGVRKPGVESLIWTGWAPVGNQILYEVQNRLFALDLETSLVKTPLSGDCLGPMNDLSHWSPSGSMISFKSGQGIHCYWNLDSGETTKFADGKGWGGEFSPDGKMISYNALNNEIWVFNLDTETHLLAMEEVTRDYRWSLDGSRLLTTNHKGVQIKFLSNVG